MAISDSDFAAWLSQDRARVVLWEQKFGYESGGTAAEGTLYFATTPYLTGPSESPANQMYRGRITATPQLDRSVSPDAVGGMTAVAVGALEIGNADGDCDFLEDAIIDGREARLYLGDPLWARADFRLALVATAEVADEYDDLSTKILLRDQRILIDKAIAGDVVNDNRRKPIVLCYGSGVGYSIEPVEKDATALTYYCLQNYGSARAPSLVKVYDGGLTLDSGILWSENNTNLTANAGTDTLTRVAHGLAVNDVFIPTTTGTVFAGLTAGLQYWVISSGLTADNFKLSLTRGGSAVDITGTTFSGFISARRRRYYDNLTVDGTIQLSSAATKRLTIDVIGFSPTQTTDNALGELLRAILIDYGGIAAGSVDSTSFRAAGSDLTTVTEVQAAGRAITQRENVIDVMDDIARVCQICWGPDHQGTFRAFRIDLSALASATPDYMLTQNDLFSSPKMSNSRVINGTIALNSRKNAVPLTYGELLDAVTVADKRTLASQFRETKENTAPSGTSYASNWQSYHKTAARVEVPGAFSETDTGFGPYLTTMADEIVGDEKPHIKVIQIFTDLRAYSWVLGRVVLFTYPRHGFSAGRNCRIIGVSTQLAKETVTVTLITRVAPDTTSASHN